MNLKSFDLNIKIHLNKLIKIANKRFPKRTWLVEVFFWEDTDFRIRLESSWGNKRDCFSYQKSDKKYEYRKESLEKRWIPEKKEELKKEDFK